jgi:hypothetical protein
VRSIAIGSTLCACVAIAGDRTTAAAPVDGLIAALTVADSDRSSIETAREPDGRMKVVLRGDFYDGRRFLKAIFAGLSANDPTGSVSDINLDIINPIAIGADSRVDPVLQAVTNDWSFTPSPPRTTSGAAGSSR